MWAVTAALGALGAADAATSGGANSVSPWPRAPQPTGVPQGCVVPVGAVGHAGLACVVLAYAHPVACRAGPGAAPAAGGRRRARPLRVVRLAQAAGHQPRHGGGHHLGHDPKGHGHGRQRRVLLLAVLVRELRRALPEPLGPRHVVQLCWLHGHAGDAQGRRHGEDRLHLQLLGRRLRAQGGLDHADLLALRRRGHRLPLPARG